jgi:hypothetical protein
VAVRSKKYLRTNFPSRPDSGAPQDRQATARSTVAGPAFTLTSSRVLKNASGPDVRFRGDNRTSQSHFELGVLNIFY